MNKQRKLALKVAAAMLFLMTVATSTFAEPRPRHETWRDDRGRDARSYDRRYDRRSSGRYITGTVHRVDYRRGILYVRDDYSRRLIRVDADRLDYGRRSRRGRSIDLYDLRRGDRVTLSGEWRRNGLFEAYRIDHVQTARRSYPW